MLGCVGFVIQRSLCYLVVHDLIVYQVSHESWVDNASDVLCLSPCFYTFLVIIGVVHYKVVLWDTGGHWCMWPSPLLALVSTVGKLRLVVVAVQGAPLFKALGP